MADEITQVTGLETPEESEELRLLAQLEEIRKRKGATTPPPAPSPLEIADPLNEGAKLSFATPEELQDYLNRFVSTAAAVTENEKRRAMEAARASQPEPERKPQDLDEVQRTRYFKLLEEGKILAAQELVDQARGVSPVLRGLPDFQRQIQFELQQIRYNQALWEFQRSHEDFKDSPQNRQAIASAADELARQGINLPITPEGFSLAWQHARSKMPAPKPAASAQRKPAPPVPNGRATEVPAGEAYKEWANLSLEEMEQALRASRAS